MIANLRLQHFRSYKDDSFEFGEGVNIVVGPNASGKTNLLEAILVLARGSSYRVKDSELVRFDKPWSRLDAQLTTGGQRTIKLINEPIPTKQYELEGKTYKRLTMQHSIPVVLFEPNHLRLLSGGPELRRAYIDDLLEQLQPGYGTLRRQYKRTLAQRNALLKQGSRVDTQLFPWNVRLSQLAGQMVRARALLIDEVKQTLPKLYKDLSTTTTKILIEYNHEWPVDSYESHFLKKLESSAEADRLRGFTSHGPHREDVLVYFGDHLAQQTASRGETRTLVLALKIIELQILAETRGTTPLLLLDDVFSELDGARRRALTTYLKNYQTFITTTDADVILHHFTDDCTVIALTK